MTPDPRELKNLDICPDARWPWSVRYVGQGFVVPTAEGMSVTWSGPMHRKRLGVRGWWRARHLRAGAE